MEFPDTQSLANNLPSAGSSYGRNRGVPSSQTYHRPPAMSSMFAFNEPSAPPITDDHQFNVALGPTPHPHPDPTMASSAIRAEGAAGAVGAGAEQIKTYGDSRRESSTYLPARRPSQQAQWHARHSGHASSSQPQPHFQSHPHPQPQPHFQPQSSARSISNSFLPSQSAYSRTEVGTGSSSYTTTTAETTPRLSSAPDPSRPEDHSSTEQPWSMGYHTSRGFPESDQNQATGSEIANHTRKSSDSEGHEHEREVVEEDQNEGDEEDGSEDGSSDDLYGWVQESAAVMMIEDGRGKVVTGDALDMNRSEQLALDLIGITHLILPTTPTPALVVPFLEAVIPSLCASLVVLDISSCNLSHLPAELATLFSLEELDVSNNPLRSLPPSLSELRSLRVLSANGIGCSNLPSSFANLQKLHTLCLRRNRLLSLPSWLGLLPNIETLLVEDNPFHGTWRPLVEQMLIRWSPGKLEDLLLESFRKSSKSENGQGYNSDSHQIQSTASSSIGISSPLSLSPKNVSFLEEDFETMIIPSDHTNSQPDTLQNSSFHNSSAASSPSSSIPRLRSNTVFQSTFSSPVSQPTSLDPRQSAPPDTRRSPNHEEQEDDHNFMHGDSTGRLIPRYHTSLGREGGKLVSAAYRARKPNDHDVLEESPMEDQRASLRWSPGDLAGSGKEKDGKEKDKSKWGFLKKMNIGKTKNVGSGGGALGSIDRRPSGPVHSNTASLLEGNTRFRRPTIARTATSVSQSTSAGTRGGPLDVSSSSNGSSSKEGFLSPGGLTSEAALLARQNKRRSYLSLDGPPSLNISIPKTSPFLSTTTFSTVQPIPSPSSMTATEGRNRRLEDGSSVIDSYIQSSENSSTSDHDHDLRHSDLHPLDLSSAEDYRQSQYAAGLHSLMGYLRDLNDLCLPPIVHSPESSMATGFDMSVQMSSPVATSVLSGQTSSSTRGSIRRPTLGSVDMKREFSESSFNFSHNGSSPRFSGIETTHSDESKGERDGPRGFKDDRVKRSRVVQEIYETELTYVRGLRDLVEIYVKPSEAPAVGNSKDTVIPLQERKIAFGGLSGLLQFHEQTFLPKLEAAATPVLKGGDDLDGSASVKAALGVADVFRTYNPFMRMYSTYINNFPNALQRSSMWMLSSSAPMPSSSPGSPNASSVHVVNMGLTMSAVTPPIPAESQPLASSLSLTTTQRKRIKAFIKRAKQHPRHTQISLDAYLLLPVQRIPRYRMLLSDLMKCTPPQTTQAYDVLEDAFKEMASLASCMNEEKRDAESRQRLVNWQSRIRGRFPSPLVQPHRKLLLDGPLTLIRLVKKNSELAEVVHPIIHDDGGDQTITPSKSLIKVECLGDPDTTVFHLVGVLTSDLFVLCKKDNSTDSSFELFAVLRMQTKAQPASVISGSTIRVVDNRAILYFEAKSPSDALNWVNMLNVSFQITR
ncbi:Invasion-inducing protein TIAM1/CDC24 and related RhoGEF GTPases [Phaffia rhodozyma]|uniref:Invasion-inducing protein TIAM1/CDC24 and related RhoGEF GTPases n=1 Tax=Phaffia rhodozyma TaxID=264483 RepID=A0A0F7SIL1_PHARH|nr:Invasion-inducing protein TIAM1/CDC24 and related RhoGEF GTPases [Phaffia rhodozyma]